MILQVLYPEDEYGNMEAKAMMVSKFVSSPLFAGAHFQVEPAVQQTGGGVLNSGNCLRPGV